MWGFLFPKIVLIISVSRLHTNDMRKNRIVIFLMLSICLIVGITFGVEEDVALAQGDYVYLGGYPIGISAQIDGLIVVEITDVMTADGMIKPLKDSGISKGDILQELNGVDLTGIYQFKELLNESEDKVLLTVKHRNGSVNQVTVEPAVCQSNEKKLGIILKEDVSGIGTMTFVTIDGKFGALGHHIIDGESGLSKGLDCGKIYKTAVNDVVKGQQGKAGGLVASLNKKSNPVGELNKNSNIGIYGCFLGSPYGKLIEIADEGEATMGKAQIYTTIEGDTPSLYDVEIVKVIDQYMPKEKGLVILVKDERLLSKTGGIVQGMSGSPIIQNGKLIGAVTHVFIDDPTRGYGVHARFMYDVATEKCDVDVPKAA